jgi:hypothetical protein
MVQNWRGMTRHSFGFQVQCGECHAWVTEVSAQDVVEARAGKGRCRECVAKSPAIVEVPVASAPAEPTAPPQGPVAPPTVEEVDPEETVAELKAEAKEAYAAQAYPEETVSELKAEAKEAAEETAKEPPKKR